MEAMPSSPSLHAWRNRPVGSGHHESRPSRDLRRGTRPRRCNRWPALPGEPAGPRSSLRPSRSEQIVRFLQHSTFFGAGSHSGTDFLLRCRPGTTTGADFSMYSQTDYYRRLAIQAKQRAVGAADASISATLVEIANHWIALAEQVEWLQEQVTEATWRGSRLPATNPPQHSRRAS